MPDAVAAAVVAWTTLTGTAATIANAAIQVAIYAGAAAVVQNNTKEKPQGGLIDLQLNSAAPRQMVVGKRLTGGVLVDWYLAGSNNTKLYMPVYLSEGPCGQITRVFAGGREVWSTPLVHGVRTTIPDFRSGGDRLWLTYYDGRAGQTADPTLVALSQGWTSANKMTGCAWVLVECQWDSDNMRSPPQLTFEMQGAKLYDRRKDTTAGGSGSHRIDNPSTWEWTDNAAVALDHFLLGRYTGSIRTFGIGLSSDEVPYDRFAAQANICDEDVDLKAGGTQKRYRANGFIFANDDYSTTITKLCTAMAARPADFGGRFGVIGIESRTPVMTIADADLIADAQEIYTPKRSWSALVGAIEGRYQDPAQLYQPVDYPRVTDAAWDAEDGGEPKVMTLDLEFETDVERAQRLALLKARAERRQASLRGVYPLKCVELERGDWFIRTGAKWGDDGKTFEVLERVLNTDSWTVTIIAQEVDPDDSAWDESTASDGPPAPISGTDTLSDVQVPAITVSAVTLTGTASSIPALKIQWTSPTDPRVRSLYVECENTDGTTPKSTKIVSLPSNVNSVVFQDGIVDGDGYAVSAKFLTDTLPSDWCVATIISASGTYAVGSASSVPWSGVSSRPANLSSLGGTEPIKNELVAMGQNALRNATFNVSGYYFAQGSGTSAPVITYDTNVSLRRALLTSSGSVATATNVSLTGGANNQQPCVPGDRIEASAYLGATGWSHGQLNVYFYNSVGTFEANVVAQAATSLSGKDGSGNLSTFLRMGGIVTAPANAVAYTVVPVFRNDSGGSISSPVGRVTLPFMRKADATQTALSPWSPGFEAVPGADITNANIAAGFTGQGALAVLSSLAYGGGYLTGFGNLAARADVYFGSSFVLETAGGAQVTLANFKTSLGTSAGFTGQGALATLSSLAYGGAYLTGFGGLAALAQVNLGVSGQVYRDDGTTRLTDVLAVTSLGIASGIASQGALATVNQAAWGSQVSGRPSNLAALSGSESVNNALVAMGPNALRQSEFRISSFFYTQGTPTPTVAYDSNNGLRRANLTSSGSVANGNAGQLTAGATNLLPVQAGDRVEASAYLGATGWPKGRIQIYWYSWTGSAYAFISASDAQATTSLTGKDGSGDLSTFLRLGGFATAPATTVAAAIVCRFENDSGGALTSPVGRITKPLIRQADTTQTALSPWAPGFEGEPGADVTLSNIAAGFTWQGALATLSVVTSTYIGAAAVLPSALSVTGDGSNMILDVDFTDAAAWTLSNGATFDTSSDTTTTMGLVRSVKTDTGNGTTTQTAGVRAGPPAASYSQVEPGKSYRVAAKALVKSGFTGQLRLRVFWYKADKTTAASTANSEIQGTNYRASAAGADTQQTIVGVVTAPSDAVWARYAFYVQWSSTLNNAAYGYLGMPRMHRTSELGAMVTREDGSTLLTDALAVTSLGTAGAISGQGGLATLSFVTISTNLRLADGTTVATTAMVVTSAGIAAAIASQGSQATANAQRGSSYSGTPVEGSWWADTSTTPNKLKFYTGGAWQVVATLVPDALATGVLDATMTSDYVQTHGSSTSMTVSPQVTSIVNGASPYTYQWQLVQMADGAPPTITNAQSSQCTLTSGSIAPSADYVGTVSCTITDANGKQRIKYFNFSDTSTI